MRPRRWLAAAAVCLAAGVASGAAGQVPGVAFANWGTEQGLPSNIAIDITQTRDGYLWLAWKLGLPAAALLVLLLVVAVLWRRPRGPSVLEAIRGGAQAALVLLLLASLTFPAFEALGITAVMGVLAALAFAPREAAA